jgi:predicted TIM-barrel fold metal-dependent hydrolase
VDPEPALIEAAPGVVLVEEETAVGGEVPRKLDAGRPQEHLLAPLPVEAEDGDAFDGGGGQRVAEPAFEKADLLVEQVVKLGMVLDVHTEHEEIDYIVDKFKEATIVFPHFGDEKEYDHIFKRIDLVAKHPNCYMDTSGYGHDRMGILEYAVKTIGPDRVLFGSDFSINDPSTVIARVENSFLTEEQKRKVLSGNLEALLARFPA